MSAKQPRALRMAAVFDDCLTVGGKYAAAELRRVHEVNQELLESLKQLLVIKNLGAYEQSAAMKAARAVIAKATGEPT